jgi:hypothetical protein
MIGQCSHQFVWPRRAVDGRYYQVCRLCEAEYEFDWETMGRLHAEDMDLLEEHEPDSEIEPELETRAELETGAEIETKSEVDPEGDGETILDDSGSSQADGALAARFERNKLKAQLLVAPPPRFLVEPEPSHRIFVRNLKDLVRARPAATAPLTLPPGSFWSDVFIPSGLPWWGFLESLLGQMILLTIILILSQKMPATGVVEVRSAFDKSYVSYYTPPKSFPALGSHSPRAKARAPRLTAPLRRPPLKVAPERTQKSQKQEVVRAPDLKLPGAARPKIAALSPVAPAMPLAATGQSHPGMSAGPAWIVAPPPDSSQVSARRPSGIQGGLQSSAVAPAPEIAGVAGRHGGSGTGLHAAVVGPAPSVSGSMRRAGDINIGESAVVKPAPQLPMDAQGTLSGPGAGGWGAAGTVVVPPAPAIQGSGSLSAGSNSGRVALSGRAGSQAVAPAPSLQGAGDPGGIARGNSLSGAGIEVVPPAPSAPGDGNGSGRGRGNSISTGLQAVPPAPSVRGEGNGIGGGRGNSLSGVGMQPAPASPGQGGGQGAGNSSYGGAEAQKGTGAGGRSGNGDSDDADTEGGATVEIPLHLIGPVLALPGSSYFSNYEVFIAERKLGNNHTQLIKLVYVSLPYQRRLAEYGPNNWTVPKLRVTRDQSCDESLLQMTWPETDPRPDPQHTADSPALTPKDRKGMLPCYRTTADDYRRALSRNR